MSEEMEVLKGYVESLGLHEKDTLVISDITQLLEDLKDNGEYGLANWVSACNPRELARFIKEEMEF